MNVVDSSAWLEYFGDGSNAAFFAKAIENTSELIVPALSVFEVFKRVMQQRGETPALQAVALMQQGRIVPLDGALAIAAARLSLSLRLPLADSIMLATARTFEAEFWTQDADFKDIAGVHYCEAGRQRR
jgi:predicted nucleic acid-binding protein